MANTLATALSYLSFGLSVIPVLPDGSKQPRLKWQKYQQQLPTEAEVTRWFGGDAKNGIAIIAGAISKGLEVIDFDDPEVFLPWCELLSEWGHGVLLDRLVIVETPSGGKHVCYRSPGGVSGNQKLANRPGSNNRPQVRIETRGEGGYVLAPGSPAKCHPRNKEYVLERGSMREIPIISMEERDVLISAARSFDLCAHEETHSAGRPGDEFNQKAKWSELLTPRGWILSKTAGDTEHWQRPGNPGKPGTSATTNYGGADLLYVFSSNAAPFDPNKAYSKFTAYALLEHGGDFRAAAKQLGKKGYGSIVQPILRIPPRMDNTSVQGFDELYEINTDAANAVRFVRDWGHVLRYCKEAQHCVYDGKKWHWNEKGAWTELAKQTVAKMSREIEEAPEAARVRLAKWINKSQNCDRIMAMIRLAESDPRLKCNITDFDADPLLFNCENGTINLSTGELQPHRPEDMCSKLSPVPYDRFAKCPLFMTVMERAFESPDMIGLLRRLGGYSLTGYKKYHVPIGTGKGANGKTIIFSAMQSVFGDYQLTAPAATFMKRPDGQIPNDIARLAGIRYVCVLEVTRGQVFDDGLIKNITSNEQMSARFLNREWFDFDFIAMCWFRANTLPRVNDPTNSIWRRLLVLPFEVTIPEEERDPMLGEKLLAERAGILAWLVNGCLEYMNLGLLAPDKVLDRTKEYRENSDPVGEFVADRCNMYGTATGRELYVAYKAFCDLYGYRPMNLSKFGVELMDRDFDPPLEKKRMTAGMRYTGISLKGE